MNLHQIHSILLTKAKSKHYVDRYIKFIFACKDMNKNISSDEYTEKHHILPRADDMFPEFQDFDRDYTWNKVILTARQHFIAHFMTFKAFGGSQAFAFYSMCTRKSKRHKFVKINARLYESSKKEVINLLRESNKVVWFINYDTGESVKIKKSDVKTIEEYVVNPNWNRGKLLPNSKKIVNKITGEIEYICIKNKKDICLLSDWEYVIKKTKRNVTGCHTYFNPENPSETRKILKDQNPPIGWLKGSPNHKSTVKKVGYYDPITNRQFYIPENEEVPTNLIKGNITSSEKAKDKSVYIDSSGKTYKLNVDDPLIAELNLVGINARLTTCEHCNQQVKNATYYTYHGKYCQQNPERLLLPEKRFKFFNVKTLEEKICVRDEVKDDPNWRSPQFKVWSIYRSDGSLFREGIVDFVKFCKDHNIPQAPMRETVTTGKPMYSKLNMYSHCNGWYAKIFAIEDYAKMKKSI